VVVEVVSNGSNGGNNSVFRMSGTPNEGLFGERKGTQGVPVRTVVTSSSATVNGRNQVGSSKCNVRTEQTAAGVPAVVAS